MKKCDWIAACNGGHHPFLLHNLLILKYLYSRSRLVAVSRAIIVGNRPTGRWFDG